MIAWPDRDPAAAPPAAGSTLDADTLATARTIVDDVRRHGSAAVRQHAERFGELAAGAALWFDRPQLQAAFASLPLAQRELLRSTAAAIERFARAQRDAIREFDLPVPGGRACQRLAPVARAGCYAPGGRSSLPSSLLMTAVTARAAGVPTVLAASPKPGPLLLAAAHIANVDAVLAVGGAHAIAALAYGIDGGEPCAVIAGPGNRFVAAAKQLVHGQCGVDLPAGPSELVVLADDTADPALVAADLLAQAEHDADARAWLVTWKPGLAAAVRRELAIQLATLPTAATARLALAASGAVTCTDLAGAIAWCDRLAPEHLQLVLADSAAVAPRLAHYGALFLGRHGAEVFGDYGIGPNHVLPTAGAARFCGGLSVLQFLRVRTWLQLDRIDPAVAAAAAQFAALEGLPGHAAAAERRLLAGAGGRRHDP